MSRPPYTLLNQTGENILVAFITYISGETHYAWQVVAPSQVDPLEVAVPEKMELLANYDGKTAYDGKQTNSVWWDITAGEQGNYEAVWNKSEEVVELIALNEPPGQGDIKVVNTSGFHLYIHPKFGSNEYRPPLYMLNNIQAYYTFKWPLAIAVVKDYQQYEPPQGELYITGTLLSDLVDFSPGQTAVITPAASTGYKIEIN